MADSINNKQDLIDSRDVDERISELEQERENLLEDIRQVEGDKAEQTMAEDELQAFDNEEGQELEDLLSLKTECQSMTDEWKYGITLIHENYFEQYARDLAEDIGLVGSGVDIHDWPFNHIDWKGVDIHEWPFNHD